jgi:hypothetical protein
LHPIQYLQWFGYILQVLGRLFFDHFVEKTGVDHEPCKTTLLELDFSRILSKMYQNWGPGRGGTNELFHTFSGPGAPRAPRRRPKGPEERPGESKATKMETKGAKMTPGDTKIEVLGSKTAPKMCAMLGTGTTLLVASF